jgi:hypothetical protein
MKLRKKRRMEKADENADVVINNIRIMWDELC